MKAPGNVQVINPLAGKPQYVYRIGIVLFLFLASTSPRSFANDAEWATFYEVYRLVRTNYLTETNVGKLFDAAIAAIARTAITGRENQAPAETIPSLKLTLTAVEPPSFLNEEEKIQHQLLLRVVKHIKLLQPTLATSDLEDVAIRGMLSSLELASDYLSPDDLAELQQKPASIGVTLNRTESEVRVSAVTANSPASESGIEPGMRLLAIDSIPITRATSLQSITTMLRGRLGTTVKVTIEQDVDNRREYEISRRNTYIEDLTAKLLEGNVAYVKVNYFLLTTGGELITKLKQLRDGDRQQFCGIVLDLRDNSGGAINGAVATADRLLDLRGMIVTTSGKTENSNLYFSISRGTKESAPLVVLINQNTSSGAELVAAALQDHRRATVIGSATYGIASIRTAFQLPNHGKLNLTTATMKRPSGKLIDKRGVLPNVCVWMRTA